MAARGDSPRGDSRARCTSKVLAASSARWWSPVKKNMRRQAHGREYPEAPRTCVLFRNSRAWARAQKKRRAEARLQGSRSTHRAGVSAAGRETVELEASGASASRRGIEPQSQRADHARGTWAISHQARERFDTWAKCVAWWPAPHVHAACAQRKRVLDSLELPPRRLNVGLGRFDLGVLTGGRCRRGVSMPPPLRISLRIDLVVVLVLLVSAVSDSVSAVSSVRCDATSYVCSWWPPPCLQCLVVRGARAWRRAALSPWFRLERPLFVSCPCPSWPTRPVRVS